MVSDAQPQHNTEKGEKSLLVRSHSGKRFVLNSFQ